MISRALIIIYVSSNVQLRVISSSLVKDLCPVLRDCGSVVALMSENGVMYTTKCSFFLYVMEGVLSNLCNAG